MAVPKNHTIPPQGMPTAGGQQPLLTAPVEEQTTGQRVQVQESKPLTAKHLLQLPFEVN